MKDDRADRIDNRSDCHQSVAVMLPDAMSVAIQIYQDLAGQSNDYADLKACQLHQAACKGALQHIELLMKLATVSSSQKEVSDETDIASLMAKADDELNAYQLGPIGK